MKEVAAAEVMIRKILRGLKAKHPEWVVDDLRLYYTNERRVLIGLVPGQPTKAIAGAASDDVEEPKPCPDVPDSH